MLEDEQAVGAVNYKSICCTHIPELFLDKLVAKQHFSKYGKISRFILRPKRLSCTVEYETEDAAERAYLHAGDFHGHEFAVDYAEHEVAHVQNTEEWVDADVQAELDAMNPAQPMASLHMRPVAPAPPPIVKQTRTVKPTVQAVASKPPRAVTEAAPRIDSALRMELEALLRKPAFTNEDKYRVLEARDKLIRLTTVRQTDIKKAVSTRGTCPDMCPEKERLMREFQRQVVSFEMDDSGISTISHRRAIKEYSRSSADQEVPLPHELRSEAVLQLTMLYLMHRIMDLCDDPATSLGDWFHFVWDRTRSIRKDITQQELCSLDGVQLVEQCARFHIHCAARLAGEDPSVFDKKINTENLTKCLQTLKYMYHDLRIKGVVCPSEAEFRSYIVLLNMGDANFLWELKQLPTNIQNSMEIKRAIAFFNALQNNNYVRFFDMLRSDETSYLSACILLSYFHKLRLRAMEVIYKAHNWRKNLTVMPLAHLSAVMGFESGEAAADFFQYHGWQCDEDRVMLDALKPPDMEYAMERAYQLVESKRAVSVGACICGQPLESAAIFERHQPHNSFDANGLLKSDAWTAEDQLRGEAANQRKQQKQQQQPQITIEQPTIKPLPVFKTAPPTIKTDSNLFKVPQAIAPISPRQQQQQQLARQQQQPAKPIPPSIFGGNQFSGNKAPTPQRTDIFGTPIRDATDSTATPAKPTYAAAAAAATATTIFNSSIFKPAATQPSTALSTGSIFGPPVAVPTAGNIFGAAVKETNNIFEMSAPAAMTGDNVFQYFGSRGGNAFPVVAAQQSAATTSIFGDAKHHAAQEAQRQQAAELASRNAEVERRKHELEEEQRRQQQQLEAERLKLKLLEDQRAAELQAAAEAARRRQQLEQLHVQAQKETTLQLDKLLTAEIYAIAQTELTKRQTYERNCVELQRQLLDAYVQDQIAEVAHEEYSLICHDQMILHRYLQRWLAHTRKRRQQRHLIDSTPIWATADTRQHVADQLRHPGERDNLQLIKRYRHGRPCDFKTLLWSGLSHGNEPLVDIGQLIAKHSRSATPGSRIYFKLVMSLPAEREELPGMESLCNKWLRKYVLQPPSSGEAFICASEADVALCVRKVTGVTATNEAGHRVSNECDNAHGLVFVMSCADLQQARRRLHRLLKLSNMHKGMPVAFVVYDGECYDEQQLAHALQLHHLLADSRMSAYKFCGCLEMANEFHFGAQLSRALRFVAQRSSAQEALAMQSLHGWLTTNLGEEMWHRWQQSALQNPAFAKLCSMPQPLIGLHNEALHRLQTMVMVDWQLEPEFPTELRAFVQPMESTIPRNLPYFPADWKSPERQQRLAELLRQMRLPACSEDLPVDVASWELWLLNYTSICITQDEDAANTAAYEAIKALIEQLNQRDLLELPVHERLPFVSFLPVVQRLAFAHVSHVLQFSPTARRAPQELVYRRSEMLEYQQQPWWLNYQPIEAVTIDYSLPCEDKTRAAAEAAEQHACDLREMQEVLQQAEDISRRAEENLNVLKNQNIGNTSTVLLKRELDESLYQLELAKQLGTYAASVDADLDVNARGGYATGRENISPDQKRKRKHNDDEAVSDMDEVIAHAFDLISKVEAQQDRRQQSKQRIQLHSHFN